MARILTSPVVCNVARLAVSGENAIEAISVEELIL